MAPEDTDATHHDRMPFVTWRDYVDTRIAALEKATSVAHAVMERRLESMNEFRETLRDQATRFVTQDQHVMVEAAIADLRESRATLAGAASQKSVAWAMILAVTGFGVSVIGLVVLLMRV